MEAASPAGPRAALAAALRTPATVAGVPAFVVFLICVARDGGYPPTVWYPAALFVLGLLAVVSAVLRPLHMARPVFAAAALLTAFTSWSFVSIAWAGVEDDAWDGANRTLLYLVVYLLFALLPWTPTSAELVLGAFAFGLVALGLGTFAAAASAADPGDYFIAGRFSAPMGYQNANAAIFLIALWPLLSLACRRRHPPLLRGAALAAAACALELALLAQARASVVAVAGTFVVFVLVVPGWLRTVAATAFAVAAAALAAPTLLDVYPAVRREAYTELDAALKAVALSAAALLIVGWIWGVIDRRTELSPRLASWLRRAVLAGAVAGALILVGVVAVSEPVQSARDVWNDFKVDEGAAASSNFGRGFSTNRYDLWRVAWDEFRESPVHGIGADNFGAEYLLRRRGIEEVLYPHSLELRTITQLGIVGAVLLVGFLSFAVAAALRARRRNAFSSAAASGVALTMFAYWIVHGSVDWFWEIPGLAAPAVAALAIAGRLGAPAAPALPPNRLPIVLVRAAAVVAVAAAASLALPWLSAKEVQRGLEHWREDPAAAFSHFDRARRLNPLTDKPDTLAGAIAARLADHSRMRAAFEHALARNPHNWYAELELGLLAATEGNPKLASKRFSAARSLNPREPAIARAVDEVRGGRGISLREYDRLFFERAEAVAD